MWNGCKNPIGDPRTQKSDCNAQPICSFTYGAQEGNDEQTRQAPLIFLTYSAPITIIVGFRCSIISQILEEVNVRGAITPDFNIKNRAF